MHGYLEVLPLDYELFGPVDHYAISLTDSKLFWSNNNTTVRIKSVQISRAAAMGKVWKRKLSTRLVKIEPAVFVFLVF